MMTGLECSFYWFDKCDVSLICFFNSSSVVVMVGLSFFAFEIILQIFVF